MRTSAMWICLVAGLPATAQIGMIQGTVVDEKGALLPNATVSVHARYTGPATKQYDAYLTTQADGRFRFDKVPGGRYEVCAQLIKTDFVPTCSFSKPPLLITLAEGQSATVPVTMRRGHLLRLKVNDAGGLLERNEKTAGAIVLVMVSPTVYGPLPMYISAKDARSREFAAPVPFDTDLEVVVRSTFFNLRDSRGNAINAAAGHRIPVRASAAARPATVELTLAGLAPGAQGVR